MSCRRERDVAFALSLPKNSSQRRQKWEELRNKGNFHHNHKVLEENAGVLIPSKRPSENEDGHSFLPCPDCFALFQAKSLYRHMKHCKFRKSDGSRRKCQMESKTLLPVFKNVQEDYRKDILATLAVGSVRNVVSHDDLIVQYGQRLYAKAKRATSVSVCQTENS